jgi:hypothetical protein
VFPARGPTLHGGIKIKGAGYRGGPVRLGRRHDKPYPLPRYDAEGGATLDAAKDHGRALAYGALHRDAVAQIAQAFGDTQLELARLDAYRELSGLVDHEGSLLRKDFHTVHIASANDSFLTQLSCFLFHVNFILAQFAQDDHLPDIADHRALAKGIYLRAVTGQDHGPVDIARFKSLLVERKDADWEMQQRMGRLAADPIGRVLLERLLAEGGEQTLFGTLPDIAAPAGIPPARDAAPAVEPRCRFP